MKPETLRALKGSIKHWEENCAAETLEEINITAGACALCNRFNNLETRDEACVFGGEKCPVYERTGEFGCFESPYMEVEGIYLDAKGFGECDWEALQEAMKDELEFLKSLLPQEEPNEP